MTPPERPGPSSASAPSLSQFQDEHDRMMAMFRTYQCGLMSLNLVEARCALLSLRYALAVHMRVEDSVGPGDLQGCKEWGAGRCRSLRW